MVLLIDTNVILDYLAKREGFFECADKVMKYCTREDVQAYIAFHSVSNIWFILRKKPDEERRRMLKDICTILTVTGADHEDVLKAIDETGFKDFEDCLQDKCAMTVRAQYIITRNVDDYKESETEVITPEEFCEKYTE